MPRERVAMYKIREIQSLCHLHRLLPKLLRVALQIVSLARWLVVRGLLAPRPPEDPTAAFQTISGVHEQHGTPRCGPTAAPYAKSRSRWLATRPLNAVQRALVAFVARLSADRDCPEVEAEVSWQGDTACRGRPFTAARVRRILPPTDCRCARSGSALAASRRPADWPGHWVLPVALCETGPAAESWRLNSSRRARNAGRPWMQCRKGPMSHKSLAISANETSRVPGRLPTNRIATQDRRPCTVDCTS